MRCAVDFGNTRIKIAVYPDDSLKAVRDEVLPYETAFAESILNEFKGSACIYSVVRKDQKKIDWLLANFKCHALSYRSVLPFSLDYRTPETLGTDRIAACAGAMEYAQAPFLVIDSGTCITIDFIDKNMVYRGGVISPGISMRLRAMHTFTDALPELEPKASSFEQDVLGKSTSECMYSGAINGAVYELEGFIKTFGQAFPLKSVLTGAWAYDLANKLENTTFVAPNLVLPGLIKILELNEH